MPLRWCYVARSGSEAARQVHITKPDVLVDLLVAKGKVVCVTELGLQGPRQHEGALQLCGSCGQCPLWHEGALQLWAASHQQTGHPF